MFRGPQNAGYISDFVSNIFCTQMFNADKNEPVLYLSNQQAKKNKQRHHAKHMITKRSKCPISGAHRK